MHFKTKVSSISLRFQNFSQNRTTFAPVYGRGSSPSVKMNGVSNHSALTSGQKAKAIEKEQKMSVGIC